MFIYLFGLACGLILGAILYRLYITRKLYDNIERTKIGDLNILKDNNETDKTTYVLKDTKTGKIFFTSLKR